MANQADQIQQAVCATIREEVGGLRSFVDRRIAELSAEVHATTQLMDFSESNLTGQLAGLRDQISGVLAVPSVATPQQRVGTGSRGTCDRGGGEPDHGSRGSDRRLAAGGQA